MIRNETYKKGDVIYRQGEEAKELFFVKYGMVEIYIGYDTEDAKCIGTIQEGKVFGELGIIEEKPRTTTIVAAEETVVTIVDKESFKDYIKENPNKLIVIMESLSSRIRAQSQKLVEACQVVADYAEEKKKGEVSKELLDKMKAMAAQGKKN